MTPTSLAVANHNVLVVGCHDDPDAGPGSIPLYGEAGFAAMRRAGRLAAEVLDYLVPSVKPEVTTDYIDRLAYEYIRAQGAVPAPLFYRGFPKSICTSINHVVCHGIPGPKRLKDGDHCIFQATGQTSSYLNQRRLHART